MSATHSFDGNGKKITHSNPNAFNDNYSPFGMGWLLPLLLVVFAGGLILYFIEDTPDENSDFFLSYDNTTNIDSNKKDSNAAFITFTKRLSIKLNDSTVIQTTENSLEKQLITYITSKNAADSISKNRWFDFDDLNFENNNAVIKDSGLRQVQNVAAILKNYPSVKIKIGGYTDKTGIESENLRLSQLRADAVLRALRNAGVNPVQLAGAEGYGSQFAKAAADAPDSVKQKDRRISVNVKAK